MQRRIALFCLSLAILMLILAGCSGGGENAAQARGEVDDDDFVNPGGDDDDTTGDDDDLVDDDDTAGSENILIHNPHEGELIRSRQVWVKVEFLGAPESQAISLDDVSIINDLVYFQGTFSGTINNVAEGEHKLKASANYNKNFEQSSVTFTTTLEGAEGWIILTLSHDYIQEGGSVSAEYSVFNGYGENVTEQVDVGLRTDPDQGVTIAGNTLTFSQAGYYEIIASALVDDKLIEASAPVVVGSVSDVNRVEIECSDSEVEAGSVVTCNGTVYDEDDNIISYPLIYSVNPAEAASSINANEITLILAGEATIIGTAVGTEIADTFAVTVTPGDPSDVALSVEPDELEVDETCVAAMSAVDEWGNVVNELPNATITTTPSAGVDIDGMNITPHIAVPIVVTGTVTVDGLPISRTAAINVTDPYPPIITINSPERGEFVTDSNNLTVSGTCIDEHGFIDSFTLNGQDVSLDNLGRFSRNFSLVNGLNTMVFSAVDNSGNQSYGTSSVMFAPNYLPNSVGVAYAVAAHVTQAGFETVVDIALEYVQAEIDDMISGLFPYELFEPLEWQVLGITVFEAEGYADSLTLDPLTATITPQYGGLHLTAGTTNVTANGHISYDIFNEKGERVVTGKENPNGGKFGSTEEFTISTAWVQIDADLQITASGGELQVTLASVSTSWADFEISTINIPILGWIFDELLQLIVNEFVAGILQDMIEEAIMEMIPPYIEQFLEEIDLSFDFDFFGFNYRLSADFTEVEFTNQGGTIWLHAFVDYGDGSWNPGPNAPDLPGSYESDNSEPSFGVYVPGTTTPYDIGAAIGDDILNQALHAVHRSGMLSLDLDEETMEELFGTSIELTTGELGLFFPGLWGEYGMGEEVIIRLRPMLPPVFNINPLKAAAEKAGSLDAEIQIGDFVLELSTNDEAWAKVALAMYVPAEVSIADGTPQTISLDFGDIEMYSDLFYVMEGITGNDSLFETFLPQLVNIFLPLLLGSVLEEFPIPSIEGFTINVDAFQKIGPASDWMGLFGSLLQVPAEQKAETERLHNLGVLADGQALSY